MAIRGDLQDLDSTGSTRVLDTAASIIPCCYLPPATARSRPAPLHSRVTFYRMRVSKLLFRNKGQARKGRLRPHAPSRTSAARATAKTVSAVEGKNGATAGSEKSPEKEQVLFFEAIYDLRYAMVYGSKARLTTAATCRPFARPSMGRAAGTPKSAAAVTSHTVIEAHARYRRSPDQSQGAVLTGRWLDDPPDNISCSGAASSSKQMLLPLPVHTRPGRFSCFDMQQSDQHGKQNAVGGRARGMMLAGRPGGCGGRSAATLQW